MEYLLNKNLWENLDHKLKVRYSLGKIRINQRYNSQLFGAGVIILFAYITVMFSWIFRTPLKAYFIFLSFIILIGFVVLLMIAFNYKERSNKRLFKQIAIAGARE